MIYFPTDQFYYLWFAMSKSKISKGVSNRFILKYNLEMTIAKQKEDNTTQHHDNNDNKTKTTITTI